MTHRCKILKLRVPLAAVIIILFVSCTVASTSNGNDGRRSSSLAESRRGTSQSSTTRIPASLGVKSTAFRQVSFEHWVDGSSVVDLGYIWGIEIQNTSEDTAERVHVKVEFLTKFGVALRQSYTIETLPPGVTGFGGFPVTIERNDEPTALESIRATVESAGWAQGPIRQDRLVSPSHLPISDWSGEISVRPVNANGVLFVTVAYYNSGGGLIAVSPTEIEKGQSRSGETTHMRVPARPEGGVSAPENVRVFLVRVAGTSGLLDSVTPKKTPGSG